MIAKTSQLILQYSSKPLNIRTFYRRRSVGQSGKTEPWERKMSKRAKPAKRKETLGFKSKGDFFATLGREASTIPAYAAREFTGQNPKAKVKCSLKKGWFE